MSTEAKEDLSKRTTPTFDGEDSEYGKKSEGNNSVAAPEQSPPPQQLTQLRRNMILVILCLAQFFDIFNAVAAIVSLPKMNTDLKFAEGTVQWIISAYALTFASFMLIAGRVADIIHPKPVFTSGFLMIGLIAIPVASSVNPIMAIIFRAVQGIGAAMNVPAAMALINMNITDPVERNRAYSIFGGLGATGGVCGAVIGGVLSARLSWRWVFYILAIFIIPLALLSWFIVPPHQKPVHNEPKSVDLIGVGTLTAGLILFVFALTDGAAGGWGNARVIVTLVLAVLLIGGFMFIERIVKDPAFPPRTWTNKNFTPMFFYGWSLYWFIIVSQIQLIDVFSDLWHDTPLIAAIRTIPMGISAALATPLATYVNHKAPRRVVLIGGQLLAAAAMVLFALADTRDKYWPYVVPGMIIGMVGINHAYVGCTVVVMDGARSGEEGVVGAVMNTSYQIGSVIGIAVTTSITLAVNSKQALDDISQHRGYEMGFFSIVAVHGIAIIIAFLFVKN